MERVELKNLQNALLQEREEKRILLSDFNKQKAEFNAVFQNLADAYLMIDLNGKVLKMNKKAKDMLGYDIDKEDLNLMQLALPADYASVSKSFATLVKDGILTDFRSSMKTKDNTIKYASVNASIIYDENKKPVAAQGIVRDITESHKKQAELIKSEKRLSTLVGNRDTGVVVSDENCKTLLINDKIFELFGILKDSMSMEGHECLTIADYTKSLYINPKEYIARVKEVINNRVLVVADELIMKTGKILERDFSPIVIDDVYHGHLWTFRDVTLQKRFDKNIQAEKSKYESIINNTNLGLVETEDFDKIKTINQRLLKMYDLTQEEVIGKRVSDLFPDKNITGLLNNIKAIMNAEKPKSLEFSFDSASNGKRHWLIGVSPNYNVNGKVIGFIGSHLDITNLKRLEYQKDKLLKKLGKSNEELQDYAHMVSHDLKAPLRNMDTLIAWFKEDYEDKLDVEGINTLNTIRATIEKMEHLIKGILVYSSLNYDKVALYDINLNKLVDEICTILHIPENTSVTIVNKLPIVKGDKYRFLQLFQNLIHNAIAYNNKPNALVKISCEDLGKHWKFCVEDNGNGVEDKYLKRIFEVFQKLDNEFDSSGIGLSIVKKIVEVYHGEVYAESELGKGTKIFFTLKKF